MAAPNFQIRRMSSEDIQEVLQIDVMTAALYWPVASYHFEIEKNPASRSWVAVSEEGTILGFIILWLIVDEIHIANFAVLPKHQNQGIGTALVTRGLVSAWEEGARVSFLEVRAGNKNAIHIYQNIGFEKAGIRKNYYQDNHEDALLMNLDQKSFEKFILQQEAK